MNKFDTFTRSAETDCMFANYISDSQGMNTDFLTGSLTGDSLSAVTGLLTEISFKSIGNNFRQPVGGSLRRILFEPVMRFGYLNIIIVAKNMCSFRNQLEKEIHSHTHVWRIHAGNGSNKLFEFLTVFNF